MRRRRSDFDIQNKVLAFKLWPTKIRLSNRTSVLVAKEIAGKNSTIEFYENMALVRWCRAQARLDAVKGFRYTEMFRFVPKTRQNDE